MITHVPRIPKHSSRDRHPVTFGNSYGMFRLDENHLEQDMATRVYSPAGEPFDIPRRDLADKLILEEGWTQTAPVPTPVQEEEPAPKPKRRSRRETKPVEEIEPDTAKEEDEETSQDDGAE